MAANEEVKAGEKEVENEVVREGRTEGAEGEKDSEGRGEGGRERDCEGRNNGGRKWREGGSEGRNASGKDRRRGGREGCWKDEAKERRRVKGQGGGACVLPSHQSQ